jgi:membrane protease YdiL (CAAX protease family)
MTLAPLDHVLAFLLVGFIPLWGLWDKKRLLAGLRLGSGDARVQAYRRIALVSWLLTFAMMGIWFAAGRDLLTLGLAFDPGPAALIGAAVAVLASGLLVLQMIVVQRSPEKLDQVLVQLESVESVLPHNARELRAFGWLSITAGVCEELLYRGYLIAYFGAIVSPWPAAGLAAGAFALAHAYQGAAGVLKTGVVGAVMGTLYLLSGSLWGPMLLHAMVDITSGRIAHCALHRKALAEGAVAAAERAERREATSGGEAGGAAGLPGR